MEFRDVIHPIRSPETFMIPAYVKAFHPGEGRKGRPTDLNETKAAQSTHHRVKFPTQLFLHLGVLMLGRKVQSQSRDRKK